MDYFINTIIIIIIIVIINHQKFWYVMRVRTLETKTKQIFVIIEKKIIFLKRNPPQSNTSIRD